MQAERKEKAERQREKRRSEIEKERRGACIEYNFHFDVFYDTSVLFLFHFFFYHIKRSSDKRVAISRYMYVSICI